MTLTFRHFPCSVFSELPGVVVWCLILILGKFSVIGASNTGLFLSPSGSPIIRCYTFCSCPTVLEQSVLVFFQPLFSSIFGFGSFYRHIL